MEVENCLSYWKFRKACNLGKFLTKLDMSLHCQDSDTQDQGEKENSASEVMALLTDMKRGSNDKWGVFKMPRSWSKVKKTEKRTHSQQVYIVHMTQCWERRQKHLSSFQGSKCLAAGTQCWFRDILVLCLLRPAMG